MDKLRRASLLAVLWLAACSHSPTAPSQTAARGDGALVGPLTSSALQTASIAVVDWGCLTEGVGCPFRPAFDMPPAEDAPNTPGSLAAQVSGSTVTLTWSAPAGGGAPTTYVVEAGSAAGLVNLANFSTGGTATTLTVAGVGNGTYFIRVRARNADGSSGPSNEVTLTVGAGCQPPPPPGLTASASGSTVALTWTAVGSALSYLIEGGNSAGASNIVVDTGSTATSFSGNAPNGTYYLRVRTRTSCGTSVPSNEAVVTVGVGTPPPPGSLSGLWEGTLIVRESGNTSTRPIQIDFTQSGPRLTGVARGRYAAFDLTQEGSNPPTFIGTLSVPGNTGCELMPGDMIAPSATRLAGIFICHNVGTNEFDLVKVQ